MDRRTRKLNLEHAIASWSLSFFLSFLFHFFGPDSFFSHRNEVCDGKTDIT